MLSDDEVREVAELGRRIEEHYGSPQDTEWAFDADGKAWMLQSRPVTSAGGDGRRAAIEHDGEVLVTRPRRRARRRQRRTCASSRELADADELRARATSSSPT